MLTCNNFVENSVLDESNSIESGINTLLNYEYATCASNLAIHIKIITMNIGKGENLDFFSANTQVGKS